MERVTAVRALPTYRLEIEFSVDAVGELDLEAGGRERSD